VTVRRSLLRAACLLPGILLVACSSVTPTPLPSAAVSIVPTASPTPGSGEVIPAPGSQSDLYRPNPGAIVIAIDPGHGGCLDWGVPNPWQNTVTSSEKSDTLAIGLALRDLLEAQGVSVVMTRTDDSALAGDDYPDLGCSGPPWRDVDGNGEAGFEETGRTRTRDELQARIDAVNLSRADLMVGIHVNSLTQDGVVYEIAATQTFYDDETGWGATASASLGAAVQGGVVAALDPIVDYERQDRGVEAVAYYLISRQWQEGDSCEVAGDVWCKPHRGLQLPGVLSEVGSMSLEAESEVLASDTGRIAIARGIYDGLRGYLADRPLAVRYDALVDGGGAGLIPTPAAGVGPPFWAAELPAEARQGGFELRLTNTGTAAWPQGLQLLVGATTSEAPYLASAPDDLQTTGVTVPTLAPGESVVLHLEGIFASTDAAREIGWITVSGPSGPWTDLGSAALQLALP
jgi:N-acetylmuramoyl-L-alanine amidase